MSASTFDGFTNETIDFYKNLADNNNKLWFTENRSTFDNHVMAPARSLVIALGEALMQISPNIQADPRVNKSIFRIYRDIRFGKDKTPYKTHLALWFWMGSGPKMEKPGYYFHLDAKNLKLGVGEHIFSKTKLKLFRDYVMKTGNAEKLATVLEDFSKKGYHVSDKHYKRTPRGFDPNHEYADLLLFNGITIGHEEPLPEVIYSSSLIEYCYQHFLELSPVVNWLVDIAN